MKYQYHYCILTSSDMYYRKGEDNENDVQILFFSRFMIYLIYVSVRDSHFKTSVYIFHYLIDMLKTQPVCSCWEGGLLQN